MKQCDVKPLAYLVEWTGETGHPRMRVQLDDEIEPWLKRLNPTITPLFARPADSAKESNNE
jgi:hypothetical protein